MQKAVATVSEKPDTLRWIFKNTNQDKSVRSALASNFHTPPAILGELARSYGDNEITLLVATNPSTPLRTLINMLRWYENFKTTILYIVSNENLDAKSLQKIAYSDKFTYDIAREVLTHRNTPSDVKEYLEAELWEPDPPWSGSAQKTIAMKLASSPLEKVRLALAQNTRMSHDVLELLAKDRSKKVRQAAAENLKAFEAERKNGRS